jgi:hypothetical protein
MAFTISIITKIIPDMPNTMAKLPVTNKAMTRGASGGPRFFINIDNKEIYNILLLSYYNHDKKKCIQI